MSKLGITPSQTVGPYFSMCLGGIGQNVLVRDGMPGERIRIEGRVLDGDREPIEDALIEIWQADATGHYRHPSVEGDEGAHAAGFTGFGRTGSDHESGCYWFETIRPGPVADLEGGQQAPHINVIVQARGMLQPSFTRIYFGDRGDDNARDRVLCAVPASRRDSLIATVISQRPLTFRFDLRYQGDDETVFFDF
jgi:protocatechuate 3,4-dioxygenase alpha subunit